MTAPLVLTDSKTATGSVLRQPKTFVRLREGNQPDPEDGNRIQLLAKNWASLDDLVRTENRQIEENVRMLAGQQNAVYHPGLNRYIDVSDWMTDSERRWRQRAVINRLLPWYIITHARMTENQPIVTFVPGPDRADAELAELLDIAVKSLWFEANMEDCHDRVMGWVVAAGRGHLFSRIDPTKGKPMPWIGTDMVPLVNEYGEPIDDGEGGQAHQLFDRVPFDAQGQPVARGVQRWDGSVELQQFAEPHATPPGGIVVDVFAPPQVRASWGPEPWHRKRRHFIRTYHPPEEVFDMFGVDCPPDIRGSARDIGEIDRLLYGTGFFGAAVRRGEQESTATSTEGYVEVTQMWEAPCSYLPEGRWIATTPTQVLVDGPRPFQAPYTSPLSTFEFVRLPGRNGGTTPLEALIPIQRQYNGVHSQVREHVNLSTNPKQVVDADSGLKSNQITNRPGEGIVIKRRPGVPAIEFVAPPALSRDVWAYGEMLRGEQNDIGFMAGAQDPGSPGDSGEKLKEARFNTDRFVGPTMRRTAGEYGRMFETWKAMLPLIWDRETTISYAGEDNIARTITVYPQLFTAGFVNVRPDVESMLPEGRGDRQEKVYAFYMAGMFGEPGTPQALRKFWEMARMPHLSRAAKPGGVHTTTAEQENGQLLLGADPRTIPVFEWYDDEAHLAVHENFMASPEFKKLDPRLQNAFVLHRQAHIFNMQQKVAQAAAMQASLAPAQNPGGAAPGGSKKGLDGPDDPRPHPPELPRGQAPVASPAPPPATPHA